MQRAWVGILVVSFFVAASGCEWNIFGKAQPSPGPSGSPMPSPSPGLTGAAARAAQANAELLREMYSVVLNREPSDRNEFGSMVDTLNQGASLEGVYNGFTHSSAYRELESKNPGASPAALKAFGEELARIQSEMASPTEYNANSAQPLSRPIEPTAADPDPDAIPPFTAVSPSPSPRPDLKTWGDQYAKLFIGASIFTLKRVISDEALRVIEEKSEYPEKLALWYAKWVTQLSERGVDFGLPLRNKVDERFHYNWALAVSADRVRWEVLNRLHRVLNDANKLKQ